MADTLTFTKKAIFLIEDKGPKPMDIRPIQAGKIHELLALYSHLHNKDEPLPELPVIDAVWQELMQSKREKYFGCCVDSKLVSSCNIAVIPNLTRGCRSYGVIENHCDARRP